MRSGSIRLVEFVPLHGFTSSMADIAYADGAVPRPRLGHPQGSADGFGDREGGRMRPRG
jgi:hypothetical protein